MSEETTQQAATASPEQGKKRPGFLSVLCILTFIGSGLGTLFMLLATVGLGAVIESVPGLGEVLAGGTVFFAVSTILAAGSLFGAIQMWKLKKMGFFIYTAANVIMLILPLFFSMEFTIAGAVIPVLFIVLYALNLKHME